MSYYTAQDAANMIDQARKSGNDRLAYSLYQGLIGTGGGMDTTFQGGDVKVALNNLWGPEAANQWSVNMSSGGGGGAGGLGMFDPFTGQYGYYDDKGQIQSGSLSGYDPTRFNKAGYGGVDPTYDPTKPNSPLASGATGVGLSGPITTNPDGTYSPYQPADPRGGVSLATLTGGGTNPRAGATPTPSLPQIGSGPTPYQPPGTTPGAALGGLAGVPPGGGGSTPAPTAPGAPGASTGLPTATPETWAAPGTPGYNATPRPESTLTPWDFFNDEGYQYALDEGAKGIENSAAARGGLLSGNTLKELTRHKTGMASQFYDDAYNRYNQDRGFREGQYQYDTNTGRSNYESDRDFDLMKALSERDFNSAEKWKALGFNEDQRRNVRDFDFTVDKYLRDSGIDLDKWNQMFAFNADQAGTNRDTTTLLELARMGLGATGGSGDLAADLARLLSGTTMTGAGAGASGTIGGANNLNAMISQILQSLYGNQLLNAVTKGR